MHTTNYDAIMADLHAGQKRFYALTGGLTAFFLLAIILAWGPVMRPWTQERLGMANLARATYENKIRAEAAAAEAEAATLRAQAIAIVGAVAKEYPEYRAQEFIGAFAGALEGGTIPQTFYVPTRNNVPVLPGITEGN